MSPEPDAAKAEAHLERALTVARKAAGKVLGTARSNERGAALARSREDTASSRTARSGLWLVHRRVRHGDLKEAKALLNARRHPMLLSLQRMRHDTTPCGAQSARRNVETRFIPVRGRGHQ